MSSALQTIETSSPSAPMTGLTAVTSRPAEIPIAVQRTKAAKGRPDTAILFVVATLQQWNFNYIRIVTRLGRFTLLKDKREDDSCRGKGRGLTRPRASLNRNRAVAFSS